MVQTRSLGRSTMLAYLRPQFVLDSVLVIDAAWMGAHRFRALIMDLDNTLVPPHAVEPCGTVRRWHAELLQSGVRTIVLSNGSTARVAAVCRHLGTTGIGMARKPFRHGYHEALKRLSVPESEILAVGDRLLTDVLGANLMRLATARVEPLGPDGDASSKVGRAIERWLSRAPAGPAWIRAPHQ